MFFFSAKGAVVLQAVECTNEKLLLVRDAKAPPKTTSSVKGKMVPWVVKDPDNPKVCVYKHTHTCVYLMCA